MKSKIWHNKPLILLLLLTACQQGAGPGYENRQYVVNDSLEKDSAVRAKIAPYKERVDSSMSVLLGYSAQTLEKGRPEGALGNFTADLILERTRTWADSSGVEKPDIALLNNGGLRAKIPQGPVHRGRIFRLMPFENTVELMELGPEAMRKLFEYMTERPQPIAGARLLIEGDSIGKLRIRGQKLQKRSYCVATSNFLAEGGDGMDFFGMARSRTSTGVKVRKMIMRHIQELHAKGDSIRAKKDGRVKRIASQGSS